VDAQLAGPDSEQEFARGQDYHRRDAFYRFNQTFQEFFDMSARVDTTFPAATTA
jgi:hypothetical protein